MKAYGRRRGDDLFSDPLGAPSRYQKLRGKNRTINRRLLHKQARNDAKKEITACGD